MDTLPPELLHTILSHVPKRSLPSARLVNHVFEAISFPLLFRNLLNWLDHEASHAAVLAVAQDVYSCPAAMWSPWALEPTGPAAETWVGIVWRLQMKTASPPRPSLSHDYDYSRLPNPVPQVLAGVAVAVPVAVAVEERDNGRGIGYGHGRGHGEPLTPANYARLSGNEEMSETRLRIAQNRYLMHRSLCDRAYQRAESRGGVFGTSEERCDVTGKDDAW
ncbi:uncharacterized protein L3040_001390 [Drepanopeziza brunnea f. sp. 'multigermtubi']|uniref:uncharacterized protein n=1 Tax=Drepanopeziza brunnea f. sp. 'multigermtubi' TaxID=698441 RepID=UPI00238FC382|nr:hypothetical protein L3040_001390 [Drepanopeziza brunnea f. sp. 'multigermtubi']